MKLIKGIALASSAAFLAGCLDDSDDDGVAPINYPSTYEFSSVVVEGESSVKFTGQAARQLLISELKAATGDAEVTEAELEGIYTQGVTYLQGRDIYSAAGTGSTAVPVSAEDGFTLVQADYADVFLGAGSKNLAGKTAGCDNNLSADQFIGWNVATLVACDGESTPTYHDSAYSLMLEWISAAANGQVDTTLGLDYSQLFQKFLLGAVAYSQAAEDYIKPTKGLLKQNSAADNQEEVSTGEETNLDTYTSLEHQWDEGFGYFGASLDYLSIEDATIATGDKVNQSDVSGEFQIDLLKGEYNYGIAQYASKHDYMTRLDSEPTDLSSDVMVAFLEGRQLIVDNFGSNPVEGDAFHTRLAGISDRAVKGMEEIFAISVVKYINSTINKVNDYAANDADSVAALAKYWSELKGFALGLQFNPSPVLSFADQITLHKKIGQSPINEMGSDKAAYIAKLEEARTMVVEAYGFDATDAAAWN